MVAAIDYRAVPVVSEPQSEACLAMLWLQGVLDDDKRRRILRHLLNLDGVYGVRYLDERPFVWLVDFDRGAPLQRSGQ